MDMVILLGAFWMSFLIWVAEKGTINKLIWATVICSRRVREGKMKERKDNNVSL